MWLTWSVAIYTDRGTGTRTRGAERPEVLVLSNYSKTTLSIDDLSNNDTGFFIMIISVCLFFHSKILDLVTG